jgi:hypothetical protein
VSTLITCPSGLAGTLRGMTVKEERILTDRALAKGGGQLDRLLAACWEGLEDPGPYTFPKETVDWLHVLQGDRFYALVALRVLTYGPEYSFKVTCQEGGCRAPIEWELDLNELPVRALSDESRASFLAGNRFGFELPSAKRRATFRLLTGSDEHKLAQMKRSSGSDVFAALLAHRVTEIESVDAKDRRRFLENLPLSDADALLDEFDRVDCGVDTTIEVECPSCFARQTVELPFGPTFFLPARKRTARKLSSPS